MAKKITTQIKKLIISPVNPAFTDIGILVINSRLPKECCLSGRIPAIANAHPCNTAYTRYNGSAQNMNINSKGSVTPVKNTAKTVEINMER